MEIMERISRLPKKNGLLWGAFSQRLPSIQAYVNEKTLEYDFGEPIEDLEAPWGEAQFVFINDTAKNENPPKSVEQLKIWVEKNPGKFTYPAPPDFTGSAFIRHVVYEITGGHEQYLKPFNEEEVAKKLKPVLELFKCYRALPLEKRRNLPGKSGEAASVVFKW